MYPLDAEFKSGQGVNQIKADWLNTIANMLNGLEVIPVADLKSPVVVPPGQGGENWQIHIPAAGSGVSLPSNAGKKKYMGVYLTDDNDTEVDNPDLWAVDWLRAHA